MITQGAYHGDQRAKTPVSGMGSETGNETLTFDPCAREFFIINDDTEDLTFTVTDQDGEEFTFTLKKGESLDDRYKPFVSVSVTASGAWRWIAKSGRVT